MRVLLEHTRKVLAEIVAKYTGQTFEKVNRDMERNGCMSAEEAKAYGIIDEVITGGRARKSPAFLFFGEAWRFPGDCVSIHSTCSGASRRSKSAIERRD